MRAVMGGLLHLPKAPMPRSGFVLGSFAKRSALPHMQTRLGTPRSIWARSRRYLSSGPGAAIKLGKRAEAFLKIFEAVFREY